MSNEPRVTPLRPSAARGTAFGSVASPDRIDLRVVLSFCEPFEFSASNHSDSAAAIIGPIRRAAWAPPTRPPWPPNAPRLKGAVERLLCSAASRAAAPRPARARRSGSSAPAAPAASRRPARRSHRPEAAESRGAAGLVAFDGRRRYASISSERLHGAVFDQPQAVGSSTRCQSWLTSTTAPAYSASAATKASRVSVPSGWSARQYPASSAPCAWQD